MMLEEYVSVADQLEKRISELILIHPEIVSLDSAWGLFKIKGFKCDDLRPSLFQAQFALAQAKKKYKENHRL